MTHSPVSAAQWLERIRALPLPRPVKILNVCGGHERSISAAGLRAAMPSNIELIPGPGCPVCICPEEDIHEAIQIARHEDVTLVAYGDMLRVPVNGPSSEPRSLEQAKAAGADVRPIASPLDAVRIARANPDRHVVFLAAGFETTTAPARPCWPKARRTTCLSCSPDGAPGPSSRNSSRAAPPPSMPWSRRGTSPP